MSDRAIRRVAALTFPFIVAACTEPRQPALIRPPEPVTMAAHLDVSDSTPSVGSEVRVTLRGTGSMAPRVATVTARIAYDSTALRFVDEVAASDGATRMLNAQPGVVRIAALAPAGFADGQMYVLRFTVLRPTAIASLRLTLEEMHTTARENALSFVREQP